VRHDRALNATQIIPISAAVSPVAAKPQPGCDLTGSSAFQHDAKTVPGLPGKSKTLRKED